MFPPFPAARVDRIIKDGEEIRFGNLMLTVERSHIEASFEFGYKYLDLTAEFVKKFKETK